MSRYGPLYLIICLLLLCLCSAVPITAQPLANPGICLIRDPAPPSKILNDGSDTITFSWIIDYDTTCSEQYRFEILDSAGNIIPAHTQLFDCALNPIQNSYEFDPEGLACGCYYGRIRFFSNWCNGTPSKLEDSAQVAFLVGAAARFRICKFWDLNGNGIENPGEPRLPGWSFTVERPLNNVVAMATTGVDGCTDYITVPVECNGSTQFFIREEVQEGWTKTAPNGAVNPITVNLVPGTNNDVVFGNWQPISISGFKLLDKAPWPWTDPKYVGPQGQTNPPEFEPLPPCPQPDPPADCVSPFQPDQVGIAGVTVTLFKADGVTPVTSLAPGFQNPVLTAANGSFTFGPLQWEQDFVIKVTEPAPNPPECDTNTEDSEGTLLPWPGVYFGTVATSPWPCGIFGPVINFTVPSELAIAITPPVTPEQDYGCNYFWNNQPSRVWGIICPETIAILPAPAIGIDKDGQPYPTPSVNSVPLPSGARFYEVPAINVEPDGLRPGTYRLTPPPAPNVQTQKWTVTVYCDNGSGTSTFPLPASGFVEVEVPPGTDVRVDFCLEESQNERRCFLPVTFTQQGWRDFCNPDNGIIPGGVIYNKFPLAFANFSFFGTIYKNKMLIGQPAKTVTFDGTTNGLTRLCYFYPQSGACGKLDMSYVNPIKTSAGVLAGETAALMMNIAYNDKRLMPRTPGYDLERFIIASGLYKGKKVGEVLNIANAVLAGSPPSQFGLPKDPDDPNDNGCKALVAILQAINSNYEFIDFNNFVDLGFLVPNRSLGQPDPAHDPVVPFK